MIKKKDGRWHVSIQPGGRKGQRYQRLFDTKKEAQQFERFVTTQYEQGKPWNPRTRQATSRQVFDHWYQARGMALRDGKRRYEKLKQLTKVTKSKEAFYKYRQSRLESGIKPSSLNRELSYIKAAYRLAVADGVITSNLFHNVKALPELQRELSYLTIEQVKTLLREVDRSGNKDLPLVTRLALATGARWSEAEGIKIGHVQDNLVSYIETKSGKSRHIPISHDLAIQILNRKPAWRYFKPCYSAFRRAFQRTKIELPKGQLAHVLRHSFASHFIMNGGDILTLQKILGHSDLKMTMRYAHLAPDYFSQAVKYNPLEMISEGLVVNP